MENQETQNENQESQNDTQENTNQDSSCDRQTDSLFDVQETLDNVNRIIQDKINESLKLIDERFLYLADELIKRMSPEVVEPQVEEKVIQLRNNLFERGK